MNSMDVYLTFITPIDRIPDVIIKLTRAVNQIKVRKVLECFDIYRLIVNNIVIPSGVDTKRVKVEMRAYAIGSNLDNLDYLKIHLMEELESVLPLEGLYQVDNSTEARVLTPMAETFWRRKYGKGSESGCAKDIDLTLEDCADMAGIIEFVGIDLGFEGEEGDDDDLPEVTDIEVVESEDKEKAIGLEAEEKLSAMRGLGNVKAVLRRFIATRELSKLREEKGLAPLAGSMHMCFMGNPGTAKTTVARLLADILAGRGLIKNRKVIECGRADVVGKYIGHTACLVKKKFDEADGGILFIDEAYALASDPDDHRDFGYEAVATIVQEMENRRGRVMVIFAGYAREMEQFLMMNPGMPSRIAEKVYFDDYSPMELMGILKDMAAEKDLTLSKGAIAAAAEKLADAVKAPAFGNGRYVRSLLEKATGNMACRVMDKNRHTERDLKVLEAEDFKGVDNTSKPSSSIMAKSQSRAITLGIPRKALE